MDTKRRGARIREKNDRAKEKIYIYIHKRRYGKKMYEAWKRVKGKRSGKLRCVPHSMRAKWSAKTETARCATGSSVGRTQGLPATSAEGSSHYPYPVHLFFVDFFQLFETAYASPSLSLLFDPFNDRGRGFHKEIIGLVHK